MTSRRSFISLLGGAAVASPLLSPFAARTEEQPAIAVVGFVSSHTAAADESFVVLFRRILNEAGYIEGHNVTIEFRWAETKAERIPELVADLVQRRVAVILATGGAQVALPAKAATRTIPIVFAIGADPVSVGLVENLNRPGGNITGVTADSRILLGKQIEVLRKLMPSQPEFAVLVNPVSGFARDNIAGVDEAARILDWKVTHLNAASAEEFDQVFATLAERHIAALLVTDEALFNDNAQKLAVLAARHRIAALHTFRRHPEAGSFASYGPSLTDVWLQASLYVTRILKGEKPADLPIMQPTKFELVINLKTAKSLGVTISDNLLAIADEVIE